MVSRPHGKWSALGWSHSGGGPGANTTLRIYPDFGYVIIVLSNLDYPAADNIAQFIESIELFGH